MPVGGLVSWYGHRERRGEFVLREAITIAIRECADGWLR